MKRLILIPFFLLCLILHAQNNSAQIEGEWLLPVTKKFNSGIINFKGGKVQSEFSRQTNYVLKDNKLTIYEDFKITQAQVYEEMRGKGYFTRIDSLNFIIRKINSDSLVLEPDNVSAKEFAQLFNTFRTYNSTEKVNPIKLYRRELSYKKIKFDSIQLIRVNKFVLTTDSSGNYSVKLIKKKSLKLRQLTQGEIPQFDSCLYVSNLESFKIPPKFDSSYKQGDRLILFENSGSVTISLSQRTTHGDWLEVPWTIKPLFDFLNSLAEKNN